MEPLSRRREFGAAAAAGALLPVTAAAGEWGSSYKSRFGLYVVDRASFRRTAKPSAAAYARLVAGERTRAAIT